MKRIDLCSKQATGVATRLWLEHNMTLRPQPKSRRSSAGLHPAVSADLEDQLARADSARASEESHANSEGGGAGAVGMRAHAGAVAAVETRGLLIFTSGGTQSTAALHQWGQNGILHRSHKLKDLGKHRALPGGAMLNVCCAQMCCASALRLWEPWHALAASMAAGHPCTTAIRWHLHPLLTCAKVPPDHC